MRHILLATDLAPNSDRALERALKLSRETCATLHIIHVLPVYKSKKLLSILKDETEDLIRTYLRDYKDAEYLDIEIYVSSGKEAFSEILSCAKKSQSRTDRHGHARQEQNARSFFRHHARTCRAHRNAACSDG